jgi:hypothetical protein
MSHHRTHRKMQVTQVTQVVLTQVTQVVLTQVTANDELDKKGEAYRF